MEEGKEGEEEGRGGVGLGGGRNWTGSNGTRRYGVGRQTLCCGKVRYGTILYVMVCSGAVRNGPVAWYAPIEWYLLFAPGRHRDVRGRGRGRLDKWVVVQRIGRLPVGDHACLVRPFEGEAAVGTLLPHKLPICAHDYKFEVDLALIEQKRITAPYWVCSGVGRHAQCVLRVPVPELLHVPNHNNNLTKLRLSAHLETGAHEPWIAAVVVPR